MSNRASSVQLNGADDGKNWFSRPYIYKIGDKLKSTVVTNRFSHFLKLTYKIYFVHRLS